MDPLATGDLASDWTGPLCNTSKVFKASDKYKNHKESLMVSRRDIASVAGLAGFVRRGPGKRRYQTAGFIGIGIGGACWGLKGNGYLSKEHTGKIWRKRDVRVIYIQGKGGTPEMPWEVRFS